MNLAASQIHPIEWSHHIHYFERLKLRMVTIYRATQFWTIYFTYIISSFARHINR